MKIKIQGGEFNRFQVKWTPGLLLEPVTQYRFEVLLVRVLQDKGAAILHYALHLAKSQRCISHMMQSADHRRAVK